MSSLLSSQNVNGVYIPSALLLVGVAIVKAEWLPYAAAFAALVGGYKVFASGPAKPRKVLIPDQFQNFPVTQITKTSHNVAIYRLGLPKPTDILGLPIGQHISLAATPKGAEKEVVRSYTPISSDEDQGFVDVMIKAYPQGNISAHMTTLKIGDTIKVRGPKGAMVYTPNLAKRIGMIAGGTGITPMLQIARAIERGRPRNGGSDTTKVDLIFANVNPDDILLKEEIDNLAKIDPDFSVYYVLNNPPENWTGGVGFVTPDMIKSKLAAPAPDVKIFICGPPPMVSALKKATESLGYQKARPVSKLEDQVFCF